ncbi:MAG: TolC family protein [Phycisphaerae bacterium]|jgi:outer membrane protein TolC
MSAVGFRLRRAARQLAAMSILLAAGCTQLVRVTDRDVAEAIAARQRQVLAEVSNTRLSDADSALPQPGETAYRMTPADQPTAVPLEFDQPDKSGIRGDAETTTASAPVALPATSRPLSDNSAAPASSPSSSPVNRAAILQEAQRGPRGFRKQVFTLTDALAYAQQRQRDYLNAREDLYLAALALTLERHLWTPQFAATLREVYGNFGEVTNFDQATRFVSDLSVAQRLPYGGQFTAGAVSTLIRDVKRTITASEGSQTRLELEIPFLRGAGHVAREDLIQLERDLTYAVRDYERFRRRQLVGVARSYFDLLRSKQAVLDGETSLRNAFNDFERTEALTAAEQATPLDVGRAEQRLLSESNRLAQLREGFRADVDQFKILIGMPVEEQIGLEDLENIESIEQAIEAGQYPLLRRPVAAGDIALALRTAEQLRLDIQNLRDQIDDAKRGVALARNALLPELNLNSSLVFDTDPEHYKLGGFESARATWRSELILAMNDRFRERNQFRAALIDVRRAQRFCEEQLERVRAEVLAAVNQIRLQEQLVEIQRRNLSVAQKQSEFAQIQFEEGLIDNRDKVEADDAFVRAQNDLNLAKTSRWSALLNFRLATDTLRVDESGVQHDLDTGAPAAGR